MATWKLNAEQLKTLVPVCASIFGAGAWVNSTLSGIRNDLDRLKTDTYTLPAAAEVALRMALANPGLRVPDPRNPDNLIESSGPAVGVNK